MNSIQRTEMIEQVKQWSDEKLTITLAKLRGITDPNATNIYYGQLPPYCSDEKTSNELQAAALKVNAEEYVKCLADTLGVYQYDGCLGYMAPEGIAWLLEARPREKAEAACVMFLCLETK